MNTRARTPMPPSKPRVKGPVEIALGLSLGLISMTLFSWFLGCLIEFVGIYTVWPDKAERHSRDLVAEDLVYIAAAPRSLLIEDTVGFSHSVVQRVQTWYQRLGVLAWYERHHGADRTQASPAATPAVGSGKAAGLVHKTFGRLSGDVQREASRWALISMYVAQDTLLRLAIAAFAAPAFALACLLGLVDGLVRRDLRRWGGGRESSFIYHNAKRYTIWALTGGFTLYLAWPFGGFNPAYMVLFFTALVALTLSTTVAAFKKYV
jgi:integrating conjugative element membrane protein (TIGR03747 family)